MPCANGRASSALARGPASSTFGSPSPSSSTGLRPCHVSAGSTTSTARGFGRAHDERDGRAVRAPRASRASARRRPTGRAATRTRSRAAARACRARARFASPRRRSAHAYGRPRASTNTTATWPGVDRARAAARPRGGGSSRRRGRAAGRRRRGGVGGRRGGNVPTLPERSATSSAHQVRAGRRRRAAERAVPRRRARAERDAQLADAARRRDVGAVDQHARAAALGARADGSSARATPRCGRNAGPPRRVRRDVGHARARRSRVDARSAARRSIVRPWWISATRTR